MQLYCHSLSGLKLLNHLKLLLMAAILAGGVGCGKRKPPLPPIERVSQRAEISGTQRGDRVFLSWPLKVKNAGAGDLNNIARVDVYRLAERAGATTNLSEEEFASGSTLIASVDVTAQDFSNRSMMWSDRLDFAGQTARLRYAVRFVNEAGQKAGFSNFIVIEPTAGVADAPSALKVRPSQDALLLSWRRPDVNVDGSAPANVLGFNIYKREGEAAPRSLSKTPVASQEFSDAAFQFGKTYTYFIRAVSLGRDGQPIESADSTAVVITPRDEFPPAAPTALTIAAAPTAISVFFASNLEKDVAGYLIYRSTDRNLARKEWKLLTPRPIPTNTYQDPTVTGGTTYYYYIVAVDTSGNSSEGSEIVGDIVP